ncbi:hypothetical protein ABW19_dt0208428 [Dactylella cylindrospora]|nr:hypothetical protein ABW19_dt0208428 [Dactylella cylindrospora]
MARPDSSTHDNRDTSSKHMNVEASCPIAARQVEPKTYQHRKVSCKPSTYDWPPESVAASAKLGCGAVDGYKESSFSHVCGSTETSARQLLEISDSNVEPHPQVRKNKGKNVPRHEDTTEPSNEINSTK